MSRTVPGYGKSAIGEDARTYRAGPEVAQGPRQRSFARRQPWRLGRRERVGGGRGGEVGKNGRKGNKRQIDASFAGQKAYRHQGQRCLASEHAPAGSVAQVMYDCLACGRYSTRRWRERVVHTYPSRVMSWGRFAGHLHESRPASVSDGMCSGRARVRRKSDVLSPCSRSCPRPSVR